MIAKNDAKKKKTYHWVNGDIISKTFDWQTEETVEILDDTPLQLFEKYFDDFLIDLMVQETNRYAYNKNLDGNVTRIEMKAFLGVIVMSGYVTLPRRRMFWEKSVDTHSDLVSKAISRNRFEFIMSNLHFADNNNLDPNDKFSKIRPLFSHLNKKFMSMSILEENHSVDESMVPYFGRHGCKQYIHGKPIRYGFKLWMGCTRLGYVNWIEPYQGATTHVSNIYKEYGVGAGVVLTYADILREKWSNNNFHLFFDNFFSSVILFKILTGKDMRGTGTIRKNRLPGNPFPVDAELKNHLAVHTVLKKLIMTL